MAADHVDMQALNRQLPNGFDGLSEETRRRWEILTKDLHSWIDPEKIREVIERGEPKIYWGTATTGKPHLGYFVPIYKISDYLAAGCHVTILFANLHGFLDNMKSTWELLNLRMQFYEIVIKAMLTYIGVPLEKLKFVRGTEYQLSEKYTLDMYRMAALVTTEHTTRAGAEVVKQVKNPCMSNLLYPILQALDEQYLDVDIQFGGVDQRKIFMFAREKLPLLGYEKRAYLMNPLIPGLGKSGKMTSSEPASKIDFDDSKEEVQRKIKKAYSVDGQVEGNGLLAICKYIVFRRIVQENRKFVVPRFEQYGGPMEFETYEALEAAFALPAEDPNAVLSGDLKRGVHAELEPLFDFMRNIIEANQNLHDEAYPDAHAARLAAKAEKEKGKGPQEPKEGAKKPKQQQQQQQKQPQQQKQKQKQQPAQGKGANKKAEADDGVVRPTRADLRVGKVLKVETHSSSDTLFVEQIDVGEASPRQVVSGLAAYMKAEELEGRKVIVVCNLRASNFRGVRSEGMVLASAKDGKVEVLDAPASSKPGDRIQFGAEEGPADEVIDPRKKNNVWNGQEASPAPLQADLKVGEDGIARWKDLPLHVNQENVTSATLRDATVS